MKQWLASISLTIISLGLFCATAMADIRIKQRISMGGQNQESTRSIKGSRERIEQKIQMDDPEAAAYFPQIATITQCDLRRTVRLNDRKQLYLIEPFPLSDARTPATRTTEPPSTPTRTRPGGTITIMFSIRDTGERMTIFGLQARHLIITQEMESSVDSCNGPRRTKIETDGWYTDFSADFNCPNRTPHAGMPTMPSKPDCVDRFVTKSRGVADPGFLLKGTMTMYGDNGEVQMTQTTETLELSRQPLDPSLFEIPAGYKAVTSEQDLYAISSPVFGDVRSNEPPVRTVPNTREQISAARAIGVNVILTSGIVNQADVESFIRSRLAARGFRMMASGGDYNLTFQFRQIKESTSGKIGGILGRVAGVETKTARVDIDLRVTLSGAAAGDSLVKSRFDGPPTNAVRAAIDQALDELLDQIP